MGNLADVDAGATLLLPPAEAAGNGEALLQWWRGSGVQVGFMVTPLAEIALMGDMPADLRMLLIGGDSIRRWPPQAPPGVTIVNNYGPTETTVVATSGEPAVGTAMPSIGRPIANGRAYLLDDYASRCRWVPWVSCISAARRWRAAT